MKINIVAGMMDAGKTTYISSLLENDFTYRRAGGTTLLLLCEEGDTEYEKELLEKHLVTVCSFDEEPDDPVSAFMEKIHEYDPSQVYIEWNSMWASEPAKLKEALNASSFTVVIDGETLSVYFSNMRQLFVNMLKPATLTMFNRAGSKEKLEEFAQPFRLINDKAGYLLEAPGGYHEKAFEDVMPFDKDADFIELDEQQYGWFCIDAHKNPKAYYGKEIETVFETDRAGQEAEDIFFAGRRIMVCCMADIQMAGFYCSSAAFDVPKDNSFIKMRARVLRAEGNMVSFGVMLEAVDITYCAVPKNIIIK